MENNITDNNNIGSSRTKTEGNQKNISIDLSQKNSMILKHYFNNLYKLENQALRNGFGKMINAKNQTNPKYSFGKEKRFFTNEKKDDLPYLHKLLEDEKYGNVNIGYHHHRKFNSDKNFAVNSNKLNNSFNAIKKTLSPNRLNTINFVSGSNCATDYYYCPPPTYIYKYPKLPTFSFGKAPRETEKKEKIYDYYKLSYDKKTDKENIDKKWSKHIIGGDFGNEDRFVDNRKLYNESLSPGPGRYNPNYNYFKYKQRNYGYMGIKIKDDKLKVSTDGPKKISLSPYKIQYLIGTNQDNRKINNSLKNLFNKDNNNNRYKINNRNNYLKNYFRDQIESQKNSKTNGSFNRKED